MSDHDGMTIRGKWMRHTTLQRDWVCGECGGRLVMRVFQNDEPRRTEWRTMCYNDAGHDSQAFIQERLAFGEVDPVDCVVNRFQPCDLDDLAAYADEMAERHAASRGTL